MAIIRIRERDALSPAQVALLVLVVLVLAGSGLLLSAAESTQPVDGAIAWREGSPLRALVQVLCLNYAYPTYYQGEVKLFVLMMGCGLAAMCVALSAAIRPRDEAPLQKDDETVVAVEQSAEAAPPSIAKSHIPPILAAQVLTGLYLLWSFASSRWSGAAPLSLGGSILLTILFLWSFLLGRGLHPRAAAVATRALCGVTLIVALVAVWYYYGRNPVLRAKFPYGNPLFLASCLIPGLVLSAVLLARDIIALGRGVKLSLVVAVAAGVLTLVAGIWAFVLTGSRGPAVGLAAAVLTVAFFACRGRGRWVVSGIAVVALIAGGAYFLRQADSPSRTGRDATARLRQYAWSYAWQMYTERPFQGFGQGGYVLLGDSLAANDVEQDPLALSSRIAHAHNEWLEVLADLGSIGAVLIVAVFVLTLMGAQRTADESGGDRRWTLIGASAALLGMAVAECFGVGLRVSDVPPTFYTVLGLVWAMAAGESRPQIRRLSTSAPLRTLVALAGVVGGLAVMYLAAADFSAARNNLESERAVSEERFDDAIALAQAAQSQLNPQRALVNRSRLAEAHLMSAARLQARAYDRERRALATDPPDAKLLALASEDFAACSQHIQAGSEALGRLLAWAPGFMNAGRMEYSFLRLQAQNPPDRDDPAVQERIRRSAAAALAREIPRQPFDPQLALDYVTAMGDELPLEDSMLLIARPLRHGAITPYVNFLARYAMSDAFDGQFAPLYNRAVASVQFGLPTADDPWAAERLRIAATIYFIRGEYDGAVEALRFAQPVYERLAGEAPLGASSYFAELADCLFYREPDSVGPAIDAVNRAIELTPDSLDGRRFKSQFQQRLTAYLLASGDETGARTVLKETAPQGVTDAQVERELGARYSRLCYNLLQRRDASLLRRVLPQNYPTWVARALELAPDDPVARFLAADLALQQQEFERTTTELEAALSHGLAPQAAVDFLRVARELHPGQEPLDRLWAKLVPEGAPEQVAPQGTEPPPPDAASPEGASETPPAAEAERPAEVPDSEPPAGEKEQPDAAGVNP